MNEEEIKKMLAEVAKEHKASIQTEVKAAIAATLVDKQFADNQITALKKQLEEAGVKADTIKNLEESIEKMGVELRKVNVEQEQKAETVETVVEKHAEKIKGLSKAAFGQGSFKIEIPRMAIMKTQVARASVTSSTMAMRLPDVGQLPYLGLQMSQLFRHFPVDASSGGHIRFYDQSAITRSAAAVAEAATKPESAITWIERDLKIEKIADSIPVTKEAWADVYFIQSEIDRLLNLNLAIIEDSYLWSGTGVTPQITGVYTTASAFDGTVAPYAASVVTANIYDLIANVRVDIMNSKQSKYVPNVVVMNPVDILGYRLTKDSFGRYLFPDGSNALLGMQLVESSVVTAGTLLVGDFRYGSIYDLEGVTLEMGFINDQFVKNAMTLLAEKRETLLIRNVDADGFRKVTNITTQIAAINKV